MKHVVSVLVENHFGVLARISGLFSGRGFNIDSLTVGETQDPTLSRMTIVVHGDNQVLDQVIKQLDKLIDVIKVEDIGKMESIHRELILIKVNVKPKTRPDIMQVVNTFRAKIVDVSPSTVVIEVTGTEGKIDAMLELLSPYGIREIVRTGLISMARRSDLKPTRLSKAKSKKMKKSKKKKKR